MKKSLYIILALCLVLCLVACGGGSGTAGTTEGGKTEGNGITSNHVHCVCNGKAVNVGAHTACSNKDGWVEIATAQELTDAIAASSAAKPAFVVLTADVTIDAYMEVADSQAVNICLNGKKLTAAIRAIGILNITDCTGNGSVVGDKAFTIRTYAGAAVNVYGGTITTTGSKDDVQIVALEGVANEELQLAEEDSVFTLYNGKIQAVGKTTKAGHCVYISGKGFLKMYNGTICDGYVETTDNNARYAGNVAIFGTNSAFYMYGGEVKNGTVTNPQGTGSKGGAGGNIAVYRGSLHILGGTVSGGHANGYGGNISTNNKPEVMEFKNCVIKDGKADGNFGGNIYLNNAGEHVIFENVTVSGGNSGTAGSNIFFNVVKAATIQDCTFSGGTFSGATVEGGSICLQGKEFTVELKGNLKFENNQASDIQTRYYSSGTQSWLSVAGLTTTAPIVVGCTKAITFTTDTLANHPFVAVEGMSISEVEGKLVLAPIA